jgi:GNAT superfamily N-acetyltransferase
MWSRPDSGPRPPPRPGVAVLRAERPTVSFYRYLYDHVGGPWLWYERRLLSDERLAAAVQDPAVEVQVIHVGGVPAGYAELDCRSAGEIELAYFGLLPEFIGQGLGAYFLAWTIHRAWDRGPRRLWVHTCSLDHPRALATYCATGFAEYARETVRIADPRPLLAGGR